jgi:SAM-dependent methyltransferase
MGGVERYASYDGFAWIYNKHWGGDFVQRTLPVLEKLFLRHLPAGARVLDLCCGTGQLAQVLTERGYTVTGLDGSEEMLRYARENAPQAQFILGDARHFVLASPCHGVISTYDSLNHILNLDELTSAFGCVYSALEARGWFMFDLNVEEGYQARWRGSFGIVEDDHVCVVRPRYRPADHLGQMDITMFFPEDGWRRSDLTLTQRCYSAVEVRTGLEATGFADLQTHDAQRDLELPGGVGRVFFVCRKAS